MTGKIEKTLAELIEAQPDRKFRVLVVHAPETDFSGLQSGLFQNLMDNISSATLTGKDIIHLARKDGIVSIEADLKMGVMQHSSD
jgi:hypothetical protein